MGPLANWVSLGWYAPAGAARRRASLPADPLMRQAHRAIAGEVRGRQNDHADAYMVQVRPRGRGSHRSQNDVTSVAEDRASIPKQLSRKFHPKS